MILGWIFTWPACAMFYRIRTYFVLPAGPHDGSLMVEQVMHSEQALLA